MSEKKTIKKVVTKKATKKPAAKKAGRPSLVKDFIADDEKWNHLENYLFVGTKKEHIAMFFSISLDSVLRIIKAGTKERYGQEMTYEQLRDLKISSRAGSFVNDLINVAEKGAHHKIVLYVADNIFKVPDMFKDEETENNGKASNVFVIPAGTMNVEDFNAISSQQQNDLKEKIKNKMKDEGFEDES